MICYTLLKQSITHKNPYISYRRAIGHRKNIRALLDITQINFIAHTMGGILSVLFTGPSLFALITPFFEPLIAGKDLKGDFNIVMNRWFLLNVNKPLSATVFLCNITRSN